jgi:hypothetical protein
MDKFLGRQQLENPVVNGGLFRRDISETILKV